MSNIFLEFDLIVRKLATMELNYAVCGGLAVGLYGYIRATEDIDFVLDNADESAVKLILNEMGYREKEPWILKDAELTLLRFVKTLDQSEPFIVDFLIPISTASNEILDNKIVLNYSEIKINVVSREDLITMKKQRMSVKDRADIDFLSGDQNETV
jgi:Aminoglycoside-2''-adenylyltransferase